MLIAGHRIAGTGLGTAQFAFGPGPEQDAVATVHAALERSPARRDQGRPLAPG
jgi:hypothetical protein